MIREVEGDILLTNAKVIVHGVAPNDSFNQGLAFKLREEWPAMYKDFRHFCKTSHPKEGELFNWGSADGKQVIALFTQEAAYDDGAMPGKATLPNVNHALKNLEKLIKKEKIESLAIPKLSSGVGGLEWLEVYPVIKKHLEHFDIPVFIYTVFHPGQKATEEGLSTATAI